ncbi:SLC13 family permease [Oribacterium sp. HCP28S3_H8]|uniref:SLC13 family permease n=1 Tax=Oribacterium sp. HCP28S3_H8 TaxID=3438945 RepID=UPI003068FA80|nr:anion permease [Oribacterium sp.]
MTLQVIIVLLILAFMIFALLTHVFPFGVTGMICCTLLVLTKIMDMQTAFSGLSNPNTVMVAAMVALANPLGRTSLVEKLKRSMNALQGKSGFMLLAFIYLICIGLSQLMGQMACLTIMIVFLQTLDPESNISPSRVLFSIVPISCMWTARIPIGMGAAFSGTINGLIQGLISDPSQQIQIGDYALAGLLPAIVGTLFCIVFYRLIPKSELVQQKGCDEKIVTQLSARHELITFSVFIIVALGFMFKNQIGSDLSNVAPVAGILLLIITGVMTAQDVVKIITSDIIWMVAGISVMSTAMATTGVGDLIGKFVLRILGSNPSGNFVLLVFVIVATVMTNFMSNFGTMGVLCPIAASTALAGGMNVKAIVLAVSLASWLTAFMLPMASSAAIIGYGTGNYSPQKVLKFTLPLMILEIITIIISVRILYPMYG